MWKLKCSQGDDLEVRSIYDNIGRQFWEFKPNAGTPDELATINKMRQEFTQNRYHVKQSSDLLMRLQRYTNQEGNRKHLVITSWAMLVLLNLDSYIDGSLSFRCTNASNSLLMILNDWLGCENATTLHRAVVHRFADGKW